MKSLEAKRNKEIHVWVNDKEYEQIQKRMKQLGFTNQSAYMRKMACSGRIVQFDAKELRDVSFEMHKAGTNINQIAKRINSGGRHYDKEFRQVQEDFSRIEEFQKEILARLLILQLGESQDKVFGKKRNGEGS